MKQRFESLISENGERPALAGLADKDLRERVALGGVGALVNEVDGSAAAFMNRSRLLGRLRPVQAGEVDPVEAFKGLPVPGVTLR